MALVSEQSIARISFLYAIIIVTLLTCSTGALCIVRKVDNLQQEQESPKKEIETIIREAIRPIGGNKKYGYCFIIDEQSGTAILYPVNTNQEGVNLRYSMLNNSKVVNNIIAIATEKGSGLYGYNWYKPNYESDVLYPPTFLRHLPQETQLDNRQWRRPRRTS
jgi:signal transduction histidine kinase